MGISNVTIAKNTIKNGENGILVRVGSEIKDIKIEGNIIDTDTGVYFDIKDNGQLDRVDISTNNITSKGIHDTGGLRNVGVGFRYLVGNNIGDLGRIEDLTINQNIINSPSGKCVYLRENTTKNIFENIALSGNMCTE